MINRPYKLTAVLAVVVVCLGQDKPPAPEVVQFATRPVSSPEYGRVSAIDAQHIWVGLSYTADGGDSWTGRFPRPGSHLFEDTIPANGQQALFVTENRGWLSGLERVWATDDAGLTWSPVFDGRIGMPGFYRSHGWVAVSDGRSVRNYVSEDLGKTWAHCGSEWKLPEDAPFSSISLVDEHTGWITIASYDGQTRPVDQGVAKTEDGGCTWKLLWWDPVPQPRLFGIQFIDKAFGWVGEDRGNLLETRDGGLRWRAILLPGPGFYLQSFHLVDRKKAWVLGNYYRSLYFTLDGGAHWQAVSESDLRENRGAAREIPASWGEGLLTKIRAVHEAK